MNGENWKSLVDEEIEEEIAQLQALKAGTDEHKIAADTLVKLIDRSIEKEKLDVEREKMVVTQKFENDLKLKQAKEDRIDRIIKNILTGVSVGSGIILTIWGTNKTLRFEETGTITTTAGRKFTGKLFSWMK